MRRALMPLDKRVAPVASASPIRHHHISAAPPLARGRLSRSVGWSRHAAAATITVHAAKSQVSLRIVTGGESAASDTLLLPGAPRRHPLSRLLLT